MDKNRQTIRLNGVGSELVRFPNPLAFNLKVSRLTMIMYLEFPPALSAASIFEWDGLVHTVCNPEWIGMHCQCISQPPGCNCSLSTMHHSTMHHSTMKSEMKMFKCDFLFKQPPYYTSLFSDCVFQNGLVVLSSVSQRQGHGTIWYN